MSTSAKSSEKPLVQNGGPTGSQRTDPSARITPQATSLDLARNVLSIEAQAISALIPRLGTAFLRALDLILNCRGRVVVTGIGKSGHVARKIASTLASTGTPAFFMHPAEASHGDIGMITRDDVMLALSNSGESAEILTIIPSIRRRGAHLIAISGSTDSTLAQEADVHLDARVDQEACPLGLAPTASTTAALALGDAIAVALLDTRGFSSDDFARSHPGGSLGRRLLTRVSDVMRKGEHVPSIASSGTLSDAILEMTLKRMGMTAILDARQCVCGIFTDGDLRRSLGRLPDIRVTSIDEIMTRTPRTVRPDQLAVEAVEVMERHKVNQILVTDAENHLVGALNMHDLFKARVI